jgi:hypothetical protein
MRAKEFITEKVGPNFLYHATDPASMMRILKSGYLKATQTPQDATKARTSLPTISTTRNKNHAESDMFSDMLMLTPEGNSVILILDKNAIAQRYKMFPTSQGTQTYQSDEYEEAIIVPKGTLPIQGVLKGFYFNPKRKEELASYKDVPWFQEVLNSPYLLQKQALNEVPLPPDWDPEKLNLRQTFKDRLKYALDRAKRLGGGSSRVAMTIDYEGRPTALKVAKNAKGLAQNEAEIEILEDYYVGNLPIVIPLIDYDKANKRPVWLQTEIAKKVQGHTLQKMLHTPAMWLLTNQVRNLTGKRGPHDMDDEKIKKYYFETHNNIWQPTEEGWNIFRQYSEELAELVMSSTLDSGDLQNPANWGVYNGRPVVIDLGFTDEVAPLYGFKRK